MEQCGKVLLVDDNTTGIDILRRILRNEYRLEIAVSGEECLEKILTFKPQLVLLDIMMPDIDGYETCRRIKLGPLGGFVQVILVSCREMTVDRVRGYDALADDYIVKPFDRDELLSKVRAHFRMRDIQANAAERDAAKAFRRRMSLVGQLSKRAHERLVASSKNATSGIEVSDPPDAR
jgi:DNA-binding response OmpR family regulator